MLAERKGTDELYAIKILKKDIIIQVDRLWPDFVQSPPDSVQIPPNLVTLCLHPGRRRGVYHGGEESPRSGVQTALSRATPLLLPDDGKYLIDSMDC